MSDLFDRASELSDGGRALAAALWESVIGGLKPQPRLTLSEWADEYAYLSPENSAEPGPWATIGYQRGMMDAVTDPTIERITVKKSARVGYTKIVDHVIAYHMHQDPCPIMVVQPTIEDAKGYSSDEIDPMLRDTKALRGLVPPNTRRNSGNTQSRKKFPGGVLLLIGANSPRGFRRVTIRVIVFDEVDGYPAEGAGKEGDQIALGIKRTETYWNRKIILGSTPTIKGVSRIDDSYERSDKREYRVPCPHCDEPQALKFPNLKWDRDEEGNPLPDTAHFVCEHNGCVIEEDHKAWMIEEADRRQREGVPGYGWVATAPFRGHAGFHIWTAYSLFPNAKWSNIAEEFLAATRSGKPDQLQVFVNTVLGETWEDTGERVDAEGLTGRREDYEVAPWGVAAVTAGVDVQADRIEVEKVGFGLADQTWGLGKWVLWGDPTGPDIWRALDELLKEPVPHESGAMLPVLSAAVDSGYLTQTVARWCHPRWGRRVYAVKGNAGPGRPLWPKKPTKIKGGMRIFSIGVDSGKETVYGSLRVTDPAAPGYCHFNMRYDADHFEQLTAEEVHREIKNGLPVRAWKLRPGKLRNEALDIRVYAHAAFEGLRLSGLNLRTRARRLAEAAGRTLEQVTVKPAASAPAPKAEKPPAAPQVDKPPAPPPEPAKPARVKRPKRRAVVRSSFLR